MAKKRWRDLSPRTRKIILVTGAVDGALKAVALADLKRRDADEINGSKRTWATALTLLNTAGVLPIVYLVRGRRPAA
ncbi:MULTISPECIES: DUF5652 family protein [Pimelobacter]|uniref:DUF5652 family protein n=1 Tax=Pimelobacter TaxID=2044 RepID=UPI001C03D369|nr:MULTISPECIES: DUF5652 family protein [Pimelobacter]MBU2694154.1 hypothetical protein [Pimelobacter sp. 30-1]UUW90322.1 DUF5652 family protein [Pimelobacter simplex]UUW94152.1 DUF5652 family protein [Pimelobacter simplex]